MKGILLIVGFLVSWNSIGQRYGKTYTSIKEASNSRDSMYELDITNASLNEIPRAICRLKNLRSLHLTGNYITTLDSITFPEHLEELVLSNNRITKISHNTNFPKSLRYLNLSFNRLSQFDPLGLDSIETLDLGYNNLTKLPSSIGNYRALWSLTINNNGIEEIPKVIGGCNKLVYLDAHSNQIERLPTSIIKCKELAQLNINGNRIKRFPSGLELLQELEYLQAAYNYITCINTRFSRMPELKGLYLNGNRLTVVTNEMLAVRSELDLSENNIHDVKNITPHLTFKGTLLLIGIQLNEENSKHLRNMLPYASIFYTADDYKKGVGRPEIVEGVH